MTPSAVRHPGERRWETNLLAVVTLVLTTFGVLNCYAAGSYLTKWYAEAQQQAMAAVLGGVLFLVAANLDYHLWRKLARPLFYVTVVSLIPIALVSLIWHGTKAPPLLESLFPEINGARRWIRLLNIQVQISEVARFTVAAYLATRLADLGGRLRNFREGFVPVMGVAIGVSVLILAEYSLSMSIVLGLIGAGMIFTAGGRIDHLVPVGLLAVAGVWLIQKVSSNRGARFAEFLTPALQCEPHSQSCESLIGIGDGGIFGVGFGKGTQKMGHLPYGYSDFILSVIGEEWGLMGITFVMLLFAVFCWLGFRIARTARDPFGVYLASGITIAIGVTALMHAAVVLRMMPPTGLTLPFISAGRASLVLSLLSAGVLMSIGRGRGKPARER